MENKSPLSPHIQIYRWHISSLVSISHRITGIINIIAITLVCLWASLLILGENNYALIRIPVGVANGYKTYGLKPALVANCADQPHGADEMDRIDPFSDEIDYCWDLKHM